MLTSQSVWCLFIFQTLRQRFELWVYFHRSFDNLLSNPILTFGQARSFRGRLNDLTLVCMVIINLNDEMSLKRRRARRHSANSFAVVQVIFDLEMNGRFRPLRHILKCKSCMARTHSVCAYRTCKVDHVNYCGHKWSARTWPPKWTHVLGRSASATAGACFRLLVSLSPSAFHLSSTVSHSVIVST